MTHDEMTKGQQMTDWLKLTKFNDLINGTCLQGYVDATYEHLVEIFGEPSDQGDGYKVDAHWMLMFADGTAATIYNYKDGKNYEGPSGLNVEDITDWHIGGHSNSRAVEFVTEALFS